MDIRSKLLLALLIPVFMLSGFRCTNNRVLESIPTGDFVDSCATGYHDFGEMVTVGDPQSKFMIRLPYSWDIRESYNDSLYGVFGSNFLSIPIPIDERLAVSVTGYSSEKTTEAYFRDELIALVKDDNARVIERGNTLVGSNSAPWVLFELKGGLYTMVFYVKDPGKDDIYLIQTLSYDTVNYKVKMCQLKQLVNSFELLKY